MKTSISCFLTLFILLSSSFAPYKKGYANAQLQLQPPKQKTDDNGLDVPDSNILFSTFPQTHAHSFSSSISGFYCKQESRYCSVVNEMLKQREHEKENRYRQMASLAADKNLFGIFTDMVVKGTLEEKKKTTSSPFAFFKQTKLEMGFHTRMEQGSAFIVSNCRLSIDYARRSLTNNVVAVFRDEKSAMRCHQEIPRNKSNIFLLVMDSENVQEHINLSGSHLPYTAFDSVAITDVGNLTEGLLPHEVEQFLSRVTLISGQTVISFDFQKQPEKLKFFESAWPKPTDLMTRVCGRVMNSNCTFRVFEGFGSAWRPITYSIDCTKQPAIGMSLPSSSKTPGIPVSYLLSGNLTRMSRDSLFLLLVKSKMDVNQPDSLYIRGDKLVQIQQQSQAKSQQTRRWNQQTTRHAQRVTTSTTTKGLPDKSSRVEKESFDIIDGRPVEEERKLAEGFTFLNRKTGVAKTKQTEDPKRPHATSLIKNVSEIRQMTSRLRSKESTFLPGSKVSKFGLESKNVNKPNIVGRFSDGKEPKRRGEKKRKEGVISQNLNLRKISSDQRARKDRVTKSELLSALKVGRDDGVKGDYSVSQRKGGRGLLMMPIFETTMAPTIDWSKFRYAEQGLKDKMLAQLKRVYDKSDDGSQTLVSSVMPEWNQGYGDGAVVKFTQEASDENVYLNLKEMILPRLSAILNGRTAPSALISGECPFGMLSAKIALVRPDLNLITLSTAERTACHDDLRSYFDNNFHFAENLSPDIVHQMSFSPQLFDFQIVSSQVFSWFPQMADDFKCFLADILSLSKVTFVEVPDWTRLVSSLALFGHKILNENFEAFLGEMYHSDVSHVKYLNVRDITSPSWKDLKGTHIYMVEVNLIRRKVITSQGPVSFSFQKSESVHSSPHHPPDSPSFPDAGLNLQTLTSLHFDPSTRKKLFAAFLRLNLRDEMHPSTLFWNRGKLSHLDDDPSVNYDFLGVKELTKIVKAAIHQASFSFMDVNSFDRSLGTHLAEHHPNSTFILTHPTSAESSRKVSQVKSLGLNNVVPLELPITSTFTHHLLKSPDILRYQYFDFASLLQALGGDDLTNTQTIFGELLACGLTSFVTLPSSKILSLAADAFYPGVFSNNGQALQDDVEFFDNAEQILLMQSGKAKVKVKLHSKLHPSVESSDPAGNRFEFPWRLMSIRLQKLKIQVDHHFMYELDGHQRKYTQHVHRPDVKAQPSVFLMREEDEYKINYGTVNAISLIALLRMGLHPSMKEDLYAQFLQLPLYEDMAPWNIVFRAGHLDYIDQDTKDKTFDKLVPFAYQVMSVLMNYERAVADFGHCQTPASTQYNIHYIASCVMSDFKGPCPDSRLPVPCGDRSCQSSYIECLRALNKKMAINSPHDSSRQRRPRDVTPGFTVANT